MRNKKWNTKQRPAIVLALLSTVIVLTWIVFLYTTDAKRLAAEKEEHLIRQLQADKLSFQLASTNGSLPFQSKPPPSSHDRRRGIVICAGGNKLLINTYVSVKVLRGALKCSLPIEIHHNGEGDVGPLTRTAFEAIPNVTFVDLSKIPFPEGHRRPQLFNGYVQKIFSLYSTQFEQVLLLDADSQPLKDPVSLMDSSSFQSHGNIFWADFWKEGNSESPGAEVYRWLGLDPPWIKDPGWQCAESGQVFFDKVRHADVLEWVWFLNSHAELLYQHMLGDKDLFEVAFMLANKHEEFNRIPFSPGVPLSPLQKNVRQFSLKRYSPKDETRRYLRVGVIQYDILADPAFMHRTERTKFANWHNGYSLELMMPALFLPTYGPHVTPKEKKLLWNMNSIPESMGEVGCACCVESRETRTILERAASKPSNPSDPWHPGVRVLSAASNASLGRQEIGGVAAQGVGGVASLYTAAKIERIGAPCVWETQGEVIQKLALYPVSLLGPSFSEPLKAGFAAYEEFALLLGMKLRSIPSP